MAEVALFGPCAKRRMQAVLTGASGRVYVGENVCLNPQDSCPRLPGEGYEKCKTICKQVGHGEEIALQAAGEDARGGSLRITHHYLCKSCEVLVARSGVTDVELLSEVDSEQAR